MAYVAKPLAHIRPTHLHLDQIPGLSLRHSRKASATIAIIILNVPWPYAGGDELIRRHVSASR